MEWTEARELSMRPSPSRNYEGELMCHPEDGCDPAYDRAGLGNIFISFGTTALLWLSFSACLRLQSMAKVSHGDRPSLCAPGSADHCSL